METTARLLESCVKVGAWPEHKLYYVSFPQQSNIHYLLDQNHPSQDEVKEPAADFSPIRPETRRVELTEEGIRQAESVVALF
jgi:hypothetical protein